MHLYIWNSMDRLFFEGKKIQQRLCMLEKCILMDSDQLFESSLSC
jgi:hypothetical protein